MYFLPYGLELRGEVLKIWFQIFKKLKLKFTKKFLFIKFTNNSFIHKINKEFIYS